MKKITLIVTIAAMMSPVLRAAPLRLDDLPASTKWAVHMDNEKARDMELTGALMDKVRAKAGDRNAPEKMREGAGKILKFYDRLGDLKSVTLFGPSADEKDAVMVIRARYDRSEVEQWVGISRDSRSFTYGKHKLYAIRDDRRGKDGLICFYDGTMVVGGQDIKRISRTLDVLDRKKGSRSLSGGSALGRTLKPSGGTMLVAAAVDIGAMSPAGRGGEKKMHPLIEKIESAALEVGEDKDGDYVAMRLRMAGDEDAVKVATMARGILAMVSLMEGRKTPEELQRLLQSVSIIHKGPNVSMEMKVPTDELMEMIERHIDRMKRPRGDGNDRMKKRRPRPRRHDHRGGGEV